jgi:Ca2+-binding EF-hand superfamily protein
MKANTVRAMGVMSLLLVPVALIAANGAGVPGGGKPEFGMLKHLDTNGDGVVTKDEAQAAASTRIDETFARLDANHDGQITQDEVQAARDARRAEMEAQFEARFKTADKNGDGLLSKEEAQAGMPMLSRGFDRIDSNQDGQLTLDEIKAGRENMGHRMRHHLRDRAPNATQPDTGA